VWQNAEKELCRRSVKQPSDRRPVAQVMRVSEMLTGYRKGSAVRLRRGAAIRQPHRGAASEWRAGHSGQSRHHSQQNDSRQEEIARPPAPTRERSSEPARLYATRRVGYTHRDRSFVTIPVTGELQPGMRQHAGWTHRVGDGYLSACRSARQWMSAVFSCLLSPQQLGYIGLDRRTRQRTTCERVSASTEGCTGRAGKSGKRLWRPAAASLPAPSQCLISPV
jgi:hypothetical protein